MTLSIITLCIELHYAECHAQNRILFIVVLNVTVFSVMLLIVVMQSVVMLSVMATWLLSMGSFGIGYAT